MRAFDVTFTRTRTITEEFTFSIAAETSEDAIDEAMERDFEDADESKVVEKTGGDWYHQNTVAKPRRSYYPYATYYTQTTNVGGTPLSDTEFNALVDATTCDPCHIFGIVQSSIISIAEGSSTVEEEIANIGK